MERIFTGRPDHLLDWARWRLHLRSDHALAVHLGMPAPTLSKIRHGQLPLGPAVIVRLLDATDVHLRDLPRLLDESAQQWGRRCQR